MSSNTWFSMFLRNYPVIDHAIGLHTNTIHPTERSLTGVILAELERIRSFTKFLSMLDHTHKLLLLGERASFVPKTYCFDGINVSYGMTANVLLSSEIVSYAISHHDRKGSPMTFQKDVVPVLYGPEDQSDMTKPDFRFATLRTRHCMTIKMHNDPMERYQISFEILSPSPVIHKITTIEDCASFLFSRLKQLAPAYDMATKNVPRKEKKDIYSRYRLFQE